MSLQCDLERYKNICDTWNSKYARKWEKYSWLIIPKEANRKKKWNNHSYMIRPRRHNLTFPGVNMSSWQQTSSKHIHYTRHRNIFVVLQILDTNYQHKCFSDNHFWTITGLQSSLEAQIKLHDSRFNFQTTFDCGHQSNERTNYEPTSGWQWMAIFVNVIVLRTILMLKRARSLKFVGS